MSKFSIGDKVTPDAQFPGLPQETIGRVFTVAKVNPKNLKCTADDGGRGINYPAEALLPATPENVSSIGRPYEPVEFFSLGEIVTLRRPQLGGISAETPLVVCGQTGTKVRVALLGGDGDRYLRVPGVGLERRDRAWLAETLLSEVTA